MKKIFLFVFTLVLFSCEDQFLEMPDTSGTVDLDEIYSSYKNAEGAVARCYRDVLKHGWPTGWGIGHGTTAAICGENSRGYGWHGSATICESGLSVNGVDGSDAGADHFGQNWSYIRECYLLKENIDRVPDMDDTMKDYIKAEATALIAYRYMGMFYRYGGMPLVEKSFTTEDDLFMPRASLKETYEFTLALIQEAYNGLPDAWESKYLGRLTKGAVLAMKARLQLFAARPLFNTDTPYLSGSETNELVCFGNKDASRWNDAITSNEAVIIWAKANGYELINTGGAGIGQPNPNAVDDYGMATSTPGNREVILAYKYNDTEQKHHTMPYYYNTSAYWWLESYDSEKSGTLTNFLENYYLIDGSDPVWPKVGDAAPLPASQWLDNMDKIEPRFRVDHISPGAPSLSNPGDANWSLTGWNRKTGNTSSKLAFPGGSEDGRGAGCSTKFYYKAGGRIWFEAPLFRMAEVYLNLAEAYNETGNTSKALENLNLVHNRAGLPAITESNPDKLRQLIWRERFIELKGENRRYYDVKHCKHPDIANGIIGGQMRELQFQVNEAMDGRGNIAECLIQYWDANAYTCYWNDKMYLEPIPQSEVNKGIIVQNPGY